jgi:HEAT repeat protein
MRDLRRLSLLVLMTLAASPVVGQVPDDPFGETQPDMEARPVPSARRNRPQASPDAAPPSAEALTKRLDEALEAAAATRAALGEKAAAKDETPLRLVPDETYLGRSYFGQQRARHLALWVWLVNTGKEPATVQREGFRLDVRGRELAPGTKPDQPVPGRIAFGRRVVEAGEFDKKGPVTVPAGEAVRLAVLFQDLPGTSEVPPMMLRLPAGEKVAEVDLNEFSLGQMQAGVERIGPKGLLGIVTIRGELTPVGAGSLVEVLEILAKAQATRVVLTWGEDAPPVTPDVSNWLVQAATRGPGVPLNDGQHPALPGALRELHLAKIPEGTGVPNLPGPKRVHATVPEAVLAALGGAYEALPVEELLKEIESGHPLTRPAAVAAGGRLPDDKLPLLLGLTGDADAEIAKAAVRALREFGSAEAVGRLVELAKTGPEEPVRFAAVESLAASRYAAAHDALRALLDASAAGTPMIPPAALVPVLAKYPRPLWGDALSRLATAGDPGVRAAALEALAKLGHPELTAAFRAALDSEDERLRTSAFRILARRRDAESEELALRFALHHLESAPPTPEMTALLLRTKDARAVPPLLRQLGKGGPSLSDLIRLLSQIGGLEVRDALEVSYPRLERQAQPLALTALAQMKSPRFHEFAGAALKANDAALANTAAQQLQADGGPEAVKLLAAALLEGTQPAALSNAANGLAGIGTPEARAALRKAWRSDDENRKRFAENAIRQLLTQSPGRDSYLEGDTAAKREDWKQAAEKYSEAIELDPQFIEAWSSRASAHMRLADHAAARTDYEKVMELDPGDPAAVSCLGILRVFDGQVEEGLAFVRDRSAGFEKDDLFAYNTACLFGVASERVEKGDPARAERLRADAVRQVAKAVELGMTSAKEVDWMTKDPDLKSLRAREDFKKVVAEAEKKAAKEAPKAGAQ